MLEVRVKHVDKHGEVTAVEDMYLRPTDGQKEGQAPKARRTKIPTVADAETKLGEDSSSEDMEKEPPPALSNWAVWWMQKRMSLVPFLNSFGTFGMVLATVLVEVLKPAGTGTRDIYAAAPLSVLSMESFTFGMWGVVLAASVAYSVYSFLPRTRGDIFVVERIGLWFFVACLLNIGAWVSWHYALEAGASCAGVAAAVAVIMYWRVGVDYSPQGRDRCIAVPLPNFVWEYQKGLLFFPYDPMTTVQLDSLPSNGVYRDPNGRYTVDLKQMMHITTATHEKSKVRKINWRTQPTLWSWSDEHFFLRTYDAKTCEKLENTKERMVELEGGKYVIDRHRMVRITRDSDMERPVTRQDVRPPERGATRVITWEEYAYVQLVTSVLLAWTLFLFFASVSHAAGSTSIDVAITMMVLLGLPCGVLARVTSDAPFCFVVGWCLLGVYLARGDAPGVYAPALVNSVQALAASVFLTVHLIYLFATRPVAVSKQREVDYFDTFGQRETDPVVTKKVVPDNRSLWGRLRNKPLFVEGAEDDVFRDAVPDTAADFEPPISSEDPFGEESEEGLYESYEAAPVGADEETTEEAVLSSEDPEGAAKHEGKTKKEVKKSKKDEDHSSHEEMRAMEQKLEKQRLQHEKEIAELKARLEEVEANANNLIAVLEYQAFKKQGASQTRANNQANSAAAEAETTDDDNDDDADDVGADSDEDSTEDDA